MSCRRGRRLTVWLCLSSVGCLAPFASAADPEPLMLWPAEHAANQGDEAPTDGEPPWMSRVVATKPSVLPYVPDQNRAGSAIVICPGGGYAGLSMQKEGVEVAEWMNQRGVAAFVLRYRCGGGPNQQPIPLSDARRAIQLVRSRAEQWSIDPQRIGVLGFSAGGHLASTAATMFVAGRAIATDPIERQSSRPDFAVLVYPVISMQHGVTHGGSRSNLLGARAGDELAAQWSTDLRVTADTPPTFLVHASDDRAVPVNNSLLFYAALVDHGVAAELHVYEQGGHGFGMLRGDRPADQWPTLLEPWLRSHGVVDP